MMEASLGSSIGQQVEHHRWHQLHLAHRLGSKLSIAGGISFTWLAEAEIVSIAGGISFTWLTNWARLGITGRIDLGACLLCRGRRYMRARLGGLACSLQSRENLGFLLSCVMPC